MCGTNSIAPAVYGCGRGREREMSSVLVKARLNTRISLIDPEKYSLLVESPLEPIRSEARADEVIEKVAVVEATLDPST